MVKVTVADVVSPSYFPLIAAVELGYFAEEGVPAQFVDPPHRTNAGLSTGELDFYGGSPYIGLMEFPGWRGGKLLCSLSQNAYWMLAVRADLKAKRGDLQAVKGLRLQAAETPGMALRKLLLDAGIDFERDGVSIVAPPWKEWGIDAKSSWARIAARGIEEGYADGAWGNALRIGYAIQKGLATLLVDVRRGDGPPGAIHYTFPALVTSERLVQEHPEYAAGAVRAVVKAQRALKADPSLATRAAQRLFPAEERGMIADLVRRDAEFYDARITEEAVAGAVRFARELGMLKEPASFSDLVATQMRPLWG